VAHLPFDPSRLSASDLAIFDRMVARREAQGAGFGGPYAPLMNHPRLCEKIDDLGYFLKFEGRLPRDIYQFLVLCVAKYTGAAFEWVDHIEHAAAAGVPLSVVEALREKGVSYDAFPAPYDLVAQVLESTLTWKNVPQTLQDQCIQNYGAEGFVELVVLSGFYQMFSAINQGFGITLPAGTAYPFE
jgi:4-carboxymuconolactone decarboxylase